MLQKKWPSCALRLGWCVLCLQQSETQDHLLLHCSFTSRLWFQALRELGCAWVISRFARDLFLLELGSTLGRMCGRFWILENAAGGNFHRTVYNLNQPLISTMKAMVAKNCWFSSILEQREVKIPEIKDNEVLIKVCATGVNRGDVTDVTSSDCSICPGLECSGIIEAVGRNVKCWKVGERVCAILDGGGYAEQVAVPADFLLPLSDDIDLADAAGLPYASCSLWSALFKMSDNKTLKDKKILIREGTSGIGTLAIQYAKYLGLKVIASTGSSNKFSTCRHYGADFCVDHTSESVVVAVMKETKSVGVDFVLDYGASDLQNNIKCCGCRGKVVIVDLHGIVCSSIDFSILQLKQAEIKVFNLRSRDLGYKASAVTEI